MSPNPTAKSQPTASLRAEHGKFLATINALGERLEKLHEHGTLEQLGLAREVVDFVRRQINPHAHAEEYSLYPATDWAAGEGSKITEIARFQHQLVGRRLAALEKAISQGAPPGKLMHLSYGILGLIAAHFTTTDEVLLPYLDKAFDTERFEREVLSPLRAERAAKR